MKDEDIDLTDIPEVTEVQMENAVLRVGGQPVERGKQRITIFLDRFIVEYFKNIASAGEASAAENRGYQTLINAALGEYIQNQSLKEDLRQILREELARSSSDQQ
ncbi:BrnA antitoxin family protein [Oscillatoria sp. CS-180]|uniref:BrnA antitoxin family protein n=1 Tax=Oscillatoria sp. CS-180 TaxID=3021720 RepID=UPI00232F908A|nr:BrnA antitoxin family protein [Oscillatoria sp. CS-180]MDB9527191.1 BrnA antitoxin family protein [Oscillatoria sp. CS-180]